MIMGNAKETAGLVSVMIPTYNRPELFELTLKSALAEDYPHLEIIVCDNSTDERTAALVQPYLADQRLTYVRNAAAATKAENFAPFADLAHGEYLQWLMDDDLLAPDKLSAMVACFDRHPELTLVTSRRGIIDISGRFIGQKATAIEVPGEYGLYEGASVGRMMLMNWHNFIGEPSAVLFRRRDLANHYWLAECRGYLRISDVAMWLELLEKGDAAIFARPLSYYRRHDGQEGRQPDVILESRMEWFRLGTEYYLRKKFLASAKDYAFLLKSLLDEYYGKLRHMPFVTGAPLWPTYEEIVRDMEDVLKSL